MSLSVGGHFYDKRKCHSCGKICAYPKMLWDIEAGKHKVWLCTECVKTLSDMIKDLHDYEEEMDD